MSDNEADSDSHTYEYNRIAVYLIGFALVTTLLWANIVVAADGSVFDEDETIKTMENEGVYSDVTNELQDNITQRISDEVGENNAERAVERSLTEEYVKGEITRNIESIYAYIEGDQSDIVLAVDLTEPKEEILSGVSFSAADEIDNEIPDQQNLTAAGAPPSELDSAKQGVGVIGTLTLVLPLLALGLVGLMYHYTGRDIHRAARSSGIAFAIAGVIGVLFGLTAGGVATGMVESAFEPDSEALSAFLDGLVAIVDGLFSTIVTQGLVTGVIGLAAIGAVYADENGYFDDLRGSDDQQPQQQYPQGQQPQQGQGQQQYQQGQNQQQYDNQQYQQGQNQQQSDNQQYQQGQSQQNQQTDGQSSHDEAGEYDDKGYAEDTASDSSDDRRDE